MKFTIDSQEKSIPYRRHWKFCVGSDHATMALRTDYVAMLTKVHEDLGIQYVRFHGILSDDMDVVKSLYHIFPIDGAENFVEYNFQKIAAVYDNVLSCGMKPFVELSFMPELLGSSKEECFFYYKGNISPPQDYGHWSELIEQLIQFLLYRYGKEEVESWYFEVWNEPDLYGFFAGKKKDYYKLYEVTARTIKRVNGNLRVGGPATSGSKWVQSFLEYCRKQDVPVDFLSTHQYAGDPIGGLDAAVDLEQENEKFVLKDFLNREIFTEKKAGTILEGYRQIMRDKSEIEELPNDSFRRNAELVKGFAGTLPVIYTEWNANAIFSAESNDTRKVAAYDIKASLDTEESVDLSSIWCFSDLFEEFHHFQEEFHGGFGLMTSHGIPKPVYHALRMMSEVGGQRLLIGEHATDGEIGIAAFRKTESIQILLFRQKMKQINLPEEILDLKLMSDKSPVSVTVKKIDEQHCNPYFLWMEMGKPVSMTKDQLQDIIEKSDMKEENLDFKYDGSSIAVTAELCVNDVWLIHVCMG